MSKIEWTEKTWNPTTGCDKISQGCKNCYAEVMHRRLMGMFPEKYSKPFLGHVQTHDDELEKPLKIKKPTVWFVDSMSDLFHKSVPFEFISKVFDVMHRCPQHTFQVLTKRPEIAVIFFGRYPFWRELPNLWIGTSVEDQKAADLRIPYLLSIPAVVRFLSCEPLIGPLDLSMCTLNTPKYCKECRYIGIGRPIATGGQAEDDECPECHSRITTLPFIDWVIAGGESGHNARPMHPKWIRSLRDQCKEAGVPFFFKQWGAWLPLEFDAQPPFRFFSSTTTLIDGHAIDVIDPQDPLGKPGRYGSRNFMDAMDAIIFCDEEKVPQCDFLAQGNNEKFKPTLDGEYHRQYPKLKAAANA